MACRDLIASLEDAVQRSDEFAAYRALSRLKPGCPEVPDIALRMVKKGMQDASYYYLLSFANRRSFFPLVVAQHKPHWDKLAVELFDTAPARDRRFYLDRAVEADNEAVVDDFIRSGSAFDLSHFVDMATRHQAVRVLARLSLEAPAGFGDKILAHSLVCMQRVLTMDRVQHVALDPRWASVLEMPTLGESVRRMVKHARGE